MTKISTETTPVSMFSSVRVTLKNEEALKGFASLLVGEALMVTGIRIIQGKHGLFISMPQRKNPKTGEYADVAFPISKEKREELQKAVLAAYQDQASAEHHGDHIEAN